MNDDLVVEIRWLDACCSTEAWTPLHAIEHAPREVVSVGFLAKKDETGFTIVQSKDSADNGDAGLFVPLVNVTSFHVMRRIERPEGL